MSGFGIAANFTEFAQSFRMVSRAFNKNAQIIDTDETNCSAYDAAS
jgi:hypothetical protein